MAGLFFDAVLNIIFATAYLNSRGDATITRYVREYYGRIQFFVQNANSCGACVDEQYIFHKICVGDLEGNTALLKEAGEDFAGYKKEAFLLKDKSDEKGKPAASTVGTVLDAPGGGVEDPTDSGEGYGYSEDEEIDHAIGCGQKQGIKDDYRPLGNRPVIQRFHQVLRFQRHMLNGVGACRHEHRHSRGDVEAEPHR